MAHLVGKGGVPLVTPPLFTGAGLGAGGDIWGTKAKKRFTGPDHGPKFPPGREHPLGGGINYDLRPQRHDRRYLWMNTPQPHPWGWRWGGVQCLPPLAHKKLSRYYIPMPLSAFVQVMVLIRYACPPQWTCGNLKSNTASDAINPKGGLWHYNQF